MTSVTHVPKNGDFVHLVFDVLSLVVQGVVACLQSAFRVVVPRSKKSLEGEVVLVTGSARGLGRELALTFARENAILVLWDINEKGILRVQSEIAALGGSAHAYPCDVSDYDQVVRTASRVRAEVGDVTVVVNNAGVLQNVLFTQLDIHKIRKTIEVNLLSHFWINRSFLPRMMEMKKGHVVAISSVGGLKGWRFLADYSASKFGVNGLMEVLEEEMRALGLGQDIHFTTACPITMDTGMNQRPTTRFPFLLPIMSVNESARSIVDAVQRNEQIVTVPRTLLLPLLFSRLFPKLDHLLADFLQYNMNPNNPEKLQDSNHSSITPSSTNPGLFPTMSQSHFDQIAAEIG